MSRSKIALAKDIRLLTSLGLSTPMIAALRTADRFREAGGLRGRAPIAVKGKLMVLAGLNDRGLLRPVGDHELRADGAYALSDLGLLAHEAAVAIHAAEARAAKV